MSQVPLTLLVLRTLLTSGALAAGASTSLGQGSVWTVDDDQPADFADLQPAVDAAADGDLILVRPGAYTHVAIDAKGLTLQVDGAPGSATANALISFFGPVPPAIAITNLAPDQSVIVRGLGATASGFASGDLVLGVSSCAGAVLFEDCTFTNGDGLAVDVHSSPSVTFVRSLIDPGNSFYDDFIATYLKRSGLEAKSSTIFLYDSEVRGSLGPDGFTFPLTPHQPPGKGGDALRLTGSTAYASGTTLAGGDGGSADGTTCDPGFDGGIGFVADAASLLRALDCTITGGAAGLGSCGLADGVAGAAISAAPSSLETLSGAARSYSASSPVSGGTQIDLAFGGEPGDDVFLLIGLEPTPGAYFPAYMAVQHLAPPFLGLSVGAIDASGALALAFPIPSLGPGFAFARYPSQALFVTPASEVFHAGPSTVAIKGPGL